MLFQNIKHEANGEMVSCTEYMNCFETAKGFFQNFCKASIISDNVLPGAVTAIPLDLLR